MKSTVLYYSICLLLAFTICVPVKAQQLSPIETNAHGDMVMRKEHRRERKRADKLEKKTAKAEKRIEKKAKYKSRTKGKVKRSKNSSGTEKHKRTRSRD